MLAEFFTVATRKLSPPLSAEGAERSLTTLSRARRTYDVTATAVLEAVRGSRRYQLSSWDGLIGAVAKLSGIANVVTEDIQSAALIEGLRFVNPFQQDFDLSSLG